MICLLLSFCTKYGAPKSKVEVFLHFCLGIFRRLTKLLNISQCAGQNHGAFFPGTIGPHMNRMNTSGATIEGDSSSGGGFADSVENFDAAMRGKKVGC